MKKIVLVLILSFFSMDILIAEDRFVKEWRSECKFGGRQFSISAKSKSGDPTNDDMTMDLHFGGISFPLKLDLKLYFMIPPDAHSSICDKTTAIQIDKNNILVFLGIDDRPLLDRLGVILLDIETKKVLDVKSPIGMFFNETKPNSRDSTNNLRIVKNGTSVRLRLIQGRKKEITSDYAPDNNLLGWMQITSVGDRIATKWEEKIPDNYVEISFDPPKK